MKISKIVTHQRPHLDEIVAVWILRKFGAEAFNLDGAKWEEAACNEIKGGWEAHPSILFVGCMYSPFDEHGTGAASSAELVAEEVMSLSDKVTLGMFLTKVGDLDRNLAQVKDSLPAVIAALYAVGKTHEDIYFWLKSFFCKIYLDEKRVRAEIDSAVEALGLSERHLVVAEKFIRFKRAERAWHTMSFGDCAKFMANPAWEKVGRDALAAKQVRFTEAVAIVNDSKSQWFSSVIGNLKIVAVESDNDQISPASRFCGNDICVIRNEQGNVQILTNVKRGIRLFKAAAYLRSAEREARGKNIRISFNHLMSEGTIPECPEWHVHEGIDGAQVYNGTRSYEAVEPTALGLQDIVDIIIRSLTPRGVKPVDSLSKDNSLAGAFEKVGK